MKDSTLLILLAIGAAVAAFFVFGKKKAAPVTAPTQTAQKKPLEIFGIQIPGINANPTGSLKSDIYSKISGVANAVGSASQGVGDLFSNFKGLFGSGSGSTSGGASSGLSAIGTTNVNFGAYSGSAPVLDAGTTFDTEAFGSIA